MSPLDNAGRRPATRAQRIGICAAWLVLGAAGCDQTPSGRIQPKWIAQIGGAGYQAPTSLSASGAVVAVGGQYVDQVTIGADQFAGAGGIDGVVMSLGDQGDIRWTQLLAGPGDDTVAAVAAVDSGAVYVAGEVSADAIFAGQSLTVSGHTAALLAKLGPDGQLGWALVGQGTENQTATSVVVAPDGATYFAGDFSGTFDLGSGALTATDGSDSFVARVEADGVLGWVVKVGGLGAQHIARLAIAPDGGVALIGNYSAALTIGDLNLLPNPAADFTPFVAHLSPSADVIWATADLLPPSVKTLPHAGHAGHTALVLQDLSLTTLPSGEVISAVLFGVPFSEGSQDFEAPNTGFLTVSQLAAADGSVGVQNTLESPNALLQVAQIFSGDGGGVRIAVSWTGDLVASGMTVRSVDHRSLGLIDLDAESRFQISGTYQVDGVGLTAQDASRLTDGSIVVVAGWDDLFASDEDIFAARLP
jgi:hypothetical protein